MEEKYQPIFYIEQYQQVCFVYGLKLFRFCDLQIVLFDILNKPRMIRCLSWTKYQAVCITIQHSFIFNNVRTKPKQRIALTFLCVSVLLHFAEFSKVLLQLGTYFKKFRAHFCLI